MSILVCVCLGHICPCVFQTGEEKCVKVTNQDEDGTSVSGSNGHKFSNVFPLGKLAPSCGIHLLPSLSTPGSAVT